MTIKVDVETRTFVRLLLIVVAFVGVIFLVWKLWTALLIIIISALFALALNPPVSAFANRLPRHSRVLATALAYIVLLAVIGILVSVALPPMIDQTNRFINSLPQYIEQVGAGSGVVADFVNRNGLQQHVDAFVEGVRQQTAGLAQGVGSSLITGVSSVLTGFVTLIAVLVLTFLMLIEGPGWLERLWNLYNDEKKLERHQRLAIKMYKVITGYVNGQLLIAAIAAGVGLAALLLLASLFTVSSDAVIPLTGIIFIATLIPMIGSTIAAIIVTFVLLLNNLAAAAIFLVFFIIYQQIENNFIQPLIQSRTVSLSALSVFIAVIIGISLLGIVGGILAIPVAGCIRVLVLDYAEHRKRGKSETVRRGLWAKLVSKGSDS